MRENPIVRRVAALSDQWSAFMRQPRARVLCWQLTEAETSLFRAFIAQESDERIAEHADLFVTLDTPFSQPAEHGRRLSRALAEGCAQGAAELQQLGLAADWTLPEATRGEHDVAYLVRACVSFARFYELRAPVVLVLEPREVSDPSEYRTWLGELAREAPTEVRALVVDDAEGHWGTGLSADEPRRVMSVRAALDVPGALQELSDAAGRLDTPGGRFRDLFVRMGNALGANDLERALQLGAAAVAHAREQSAWHLAVPVHLALGSTLVSKGRNQEGLQAYVDAENDAQRGTSHPEEPTRIACRQLQLQSRLAHGAALIGLTAWPEAAALFESAVPQASEAGDLAVLLDCHRLASFCHEQHSATEQAWQSALSALAVAQQIPARTRGTTSARFVVEALRRLAKHPPTRLTKQLDQELSQLLGSQSARAQPPEAALGV
jgi:hypothetical protein